MVTEEQIQAIVQRVVDGYAPDRIIPFGSYAHSTLTEDLDLNLLIIKHHAEKKAIERDLTIRHLLWGGEVSPVDIFVRIPQELTDAVTRVYPIKTEVVQKERILYAAA